MDGYSDPWENMVDPDENPDRVIWGDDMDGGDWESHYSMGELDEREIEDSWENSDYEEDEYEEEYEENEADKQIFSQERSKPYGGPTNWFYDAEGYYAYVLLKGDYALMNAMKEALNVADIKCSYVNKSFKMASNGKQYDWYLRVFKGGSREHPNISQITDALNNVTSLRGRKQMDYAEMEQRNKQLEIELVRKQTSLETERHRLGVKTDRARELEWKLLRQREAYVQREEDLKRRIQALIDELTAHQTDEKNEEMLKRKLSELNQKYIEDMVAFDSLADKAQEEINELSKEVAVLTQKVEILKTDNDELTSIIDLQKITLQSSTSFNDGRTVQISNNETEFSSMCEALLPRVGLLWGSVAYLVNEVRDIRGALKELSRICWDGKNLRGEKVEGAVNWRELRFSTGESKRGRIYYIKNPRTGKYSVLVSDKNKQKSDIRNLRRFESGIATA